MSRPFDPEAAAAPDAGIFGLASGRRDAGVVLVPVPFDATTSYRPGTARGPAAILEASRQIDLFDGQTGRAYEAGIHMLAADPAILAASVQARRLAAPLIARGGATDSAADVAALGEIDALCGDVHRSVYTEVAAILAAGQIPGVVGGDHSVALGGIRAVVEAFPDVGVLQVDAHADLRERYEGFAHSHASIMDNVLGETACERLVQVGIRDFSASERRRGTEDPRIVQHLELAWRERLARGETYWSLCREVAAALPRRVHVSFDIDGLDPALCPGTGTPVPGGLSFAECCLLLQCLVAEGRQIVGFDLTEVAPGAEGGEWDGNVGARVLYKLCGFALLSR